MTNLEKRRDHGYRYQTAKIGPVVKVDVEYRKGDYGGKRGIYVHIGESVIEDRGNGMISESFMIGTSGRSWFVMPLERATPKKLAAIAAAVDPIAPELANLFQTDRAAADALLRATLTGERHA